jgi:hypothetical protein
MQIINSVTHIESMFQTLLQILIIVVFHNAYFEFLNFRVVSIPMRHVALFVHLLVRLLLLPGRQDQPHLVQRYPLLRR